MRHVFLFEVFNFTKYLYGNLSRKLAPPVHSFSFVCDQEGSSIQRLNRCPFYFQLECPCCSVAVCFPVRSPIIRGRQFVEVIALEEIVFYRSSDNRKRNYRQKYL